MSQEEMRQSALAPGATEPAADRMDAATQSISDALRTSFLVLKGVLLLLVVLYLGSGYFAVSSGHQAVVVQLGQIRGLDTGEAVLRDGAHWAWPWPISTRFEENVEQVRSLALPSFWFFVHPDFQGRPLDDLMGRAPRQLHPARDGYLLTGEQEIVHVQLEVRYRVDNLIDFLSQVTSAAAPEVRQREAEALLRTVAEWATLQTVGRMPTDEVVRGASEQERAAASQPAGEAPAGAEDGHGDEDGHDHGRESAAGESTYVAAHDHAHAASGDVHGVAELKEGIKRLMQQRLDELKAGMRVVDVIPRERTVPLQVRPAYLQVVQAENQMQKTILDARAKATQVLNETAGVAWQELAERIRTYETARDLGEKARADEAFAQVLALFEPGRVGGEVSARLGAAEAQRTRLIEKVKAERGRFLELYSKYAANPRIFLSRLWEDTKQVILTSPEVETYFLPGGPNQEIRMKIERNPAYLKAREVRRYAEQTR